MRLPHSTGSQLPGSALSGYGVEEVSGTGVHTTPSTTLCLRDHTPVHSVHYRLTDLTALTQPFALRASPSLSLTAYPVQTD